MIFWVDAQLPPKIARWLTETFGVNAFTLYDVGLRDVQDSDLLEEILK